MASQALVQPVCKQHIKLDSQQASLCQQRALLLDPGNKMRRNILFLTKYNCLSAECAHLRAADIKYITQMRNLRKTQVIFLSRQTISKTRPVQIERDFIRTADLRDRLQLLPAV